MDARWTGNRVCALLGTEHPVIQAGMIWNSGPDLAAAAIAAGCLGVLGAGSMRPDELRDAVGQVRTAVDGPLAVNLPLLYKHAGEALDAALDAGVRIFITSAGSPRRVVGRLKEAGCVSLHVVAAPELARKCEEAGCDAVICEGFEAGGHNGREELTTMVLVPACAAAVSVPLIAAGGVATGAQMAAALALGAEGVQVGSRFAATRESAAHEAFKQAVAGAGPADTLLVLKKHVPVRLLRNAFRARVEELEARGAAREELAALLGEGRARLGMREGDLDEGELEIGQVAGLIDDVPTAAEVVDRLLAGYDAAVSRLRRGAPPAAGD